MKLTDIREETAPDSREELDFSDNDDDVMADQARSKPKKQEPALAKAETRAVTVIRLVTIAVLVSAALVTTWLVYWYAVDQENDDFEQAFYYDANKVIDTYKSNANQRMKALESFSTSITQFVVSRKKHEERLNEKVRGDRNGEQGPQGPPGNEVTNDERSPVEGVDVTQTEFPFVTVPEFERTATYTLESAEVLGIMFLPVVETEEKTAWEEYSLDNIAWLDESMAFQENEKARDNQQKARDNQHNNARRAQEQQSIVPFIFVDDPGTDDIKPVEGPGPYLPMWQMAPVFDLSNQFINFDMHSYFEPEFTAVMTKQRPLTSAAMQLKTDAATGGWEADTEPVDDDVIIDGGSVLLYSFVDKATENDPSGMSTIQDGGGISSNMFIPVFDSWNEERRQVAGVLYVMVYWQRYLDCLLPDVEESQNAPLMAVLENTCGQSFTYEIRGTKAMFLGVGDLHDTKYDDLMLQSGFAAVLGFDLLSDETMPGECMYNVRIYPTQEMEEGFLTTEPLWFAAIVFSIFVFTAVVFILYDKLVQRRHNVVNNKAVESSAVVSSLFPEAVREQVVGIVEKANADPSKEFAMTNGSNKVWSQSPTKAAGVPSTGSYYDRLAAELDNSAPIANLYPDCTVLFCDIAGFTAWSGKRGPSEVFKLLEAIYGSFDRIAKKKQVFKVETIGDCYVAVTGLPQPQAQHAVIMTKFANDCMTSLSGMMHVLVDKLGEDTASLTMRFGLHSGPVTAGVLRGDRARFQLFGDTVNTASRMESNGQKGRIQVSQQTANLLVAAGKQHWVKPRADKIQAKGKGLLQTYWVEVSSVTASSASSGTPRTASINNASINSEEVPFVEERQTCERLSHQQHEEYKRIIGQIKQEVR